MCIHVLNQIMYPMLSTMPSCPSMYTQSLDTHVLNQCVYIQVPNEWMYAQAINQCIVKAGLRVSGNWVEMMDVASSLVCIGIISVYSNLCVTRLRISPTVAYLEHSARSGFTNIDL